MCQGYWVGKDQDQSIHCENNGQELWQRATGACRDDNFGTCWWMQEVKKVVKLKETFLARLTGGSESSWQVSFGQKSYSQGCHGSKSSGAGGGHGEDFLLASKKFWQTVQPLQKGKLGSAQSVLCWQGQLLIWTGDLSGSGRFWTQLKRFLVRGSVWRLGWRLVHIPDRGHWGSQ